MLLLLLACADTPTPNPDDALDWLSRAPGNTFVEITDIDVRQDIAWVCTGVQGLEIYDIADPSSPEKLSEPGFPGANTLYPRCQTVAHGEPGTLVGAHIDSIQDEPWIALIEPDSRELLDVLTPSENTGEAIWHGSTPLLAAHEAGILVLSAEGGVLSEVETLDLGGNIRRLAPADDGVLAGSVEGQLYWLDADLSVTGTVDLDAPVQAIEYLGDGRAAVALGSGGLALVDGTTLTGTVATRGTALRLSQLDDGHLVVGNWEDVRVFDVAGDVPALVAVEDVYDAGRFPRTLAAAASGDVVLAGEWTGLHLYRWQPGQDSPELTAPRILRAPAGDTDHSLSAEILNEGTATLTISEAEPPEGWVVESRPESLQSGESGFMLLTRLGGAAEGEGSLVLTTNDEDEATAVITLTVGSSGLGVGDDGPTFEAVGVNTGTLHTINGGGQITLLSYFATF